MPDFRKSPEKLMLSVVLPKKTPRATCRSPHGGRRNNGNLDEFREEIFTNTSIPWFLE